MYNLTVAQANTFFVGAGRWLVHNAGRCPQITLQRLSGGVGNDFLQKGLHFNYGDGEFRIQAALRNDSMVELRIIDVGHKGVPTPKQFKEYFEKNRSAILTQLEKAMCQDDHDCRNQIK
jgi:hypothetical protein